MLIIIFHRKKKIEDELSPFTYVNLVRNSQEDLFVLGLIIDMWIVNVHSLEEMNKEILTSSILVLLLMRELHCIYSL